MIAGSLGRSKLRFQLPSRRFRAAFAVLGASFPRFGRFKCLKHHGGGREVPAPSSIGNIRSFQNGPIRSKSHRDMNLSAFYSLYWPTPSDSPIGFLGFQQCASRLDWMYEQSSATLKPNEDELMNMPVTAQKAGFQGLRA